MIFTVGMWGWIQQGENPALIARWSSDDTFCRFTAAMIHTGTAVYPRSICMCMHIQHGCELHAMICIKRCYDRVDLTVIDTGATGCYR